MTDPSIDPGSNNPAVVENAHPLADRVSAGHERAAPGQSDHADKYNDPRARVTARGIWLGIAVLVLGIVGAFGSIYARRTRLGETTRFWGEETIMALQLAERVELIPRGDSEFKPVDLSGTPGLGHLRRAFLDERNYQWDTETAGSAIADCLPPATGKPPTCIQVRLTDPTAHRFEQVEIDLDLGGGWIGPSDGSRKVRATAWVQPKLRNYFATIMNVQQQSYDYCE